MLGDVLHKDRIAQIRLVATVLTKSLGERNSRPLLGDGFSFRELLEHTGYDRLYRCKNILLLDKAHLEIELVELARQPVGARILVSETGRDLEVTVEAGHHQQLLVLLRRLRQRVKLARVNPRRHQEVARALR